MLPWLALQELLAKAQHAGLRTTSPWPRCNNVGHIDESWLCQLALIIVECYLLSRSLAKMRLGHKTKFIRCLVEDTEGAYPSYISQWIHPLNIIFSCQNYWSGTDI